MNIFKKSFWIKEVDNGYGGKKELIKISAIIKTFILFILLVVIIVQFPLGTVSAGERGVRLRFGAVVGQPVNEGLYFRVPFIERVVKMDVKTQKEEIGASSASKDLQTVSATVALNYSLNPEIVTSLYKNIGIDYKARIIDPAIQEAVKASTAKFTAEELITKREEVSIDIKEHLSTRLTIIGIRIEGFSIINFDFSKSFNDAIEGKVTAEQNALASKNKLEQIKYEAQQAVEKATGNSKAIQIEANALQQNQQVLKLREIENQAKAIEKWNGNLPNVTGGAIPFINVNQ